MLKRSIDVVGALLLLALTSPLLAVIAVALRLEGYGPVLYRSPRVGRGGQPFSLLRFRTMLDTPEPRSAEQRLTPVGRLIRNVSLDDLPNLVNVLRGEMSLVGPRPERPEFVAQFAQLVPRYQERHMEKAGLTGWAQVNGLRGQTSVVERTEYDLFYVETWSLAFDIKILLKTLAAVVRDRNAY